MVNLKDPVKVPCQKCGETDQTNYFGICEKCEKLRYQETVREEEKRQHQERLAKMPSILRAMGVRKEFVECSLENYEGELPPSRPSLLTGPVGVGKTHMAIGFLRQIAEKTGSARFIREVDLAQGVREIYGGHSGHVASDFLDLYKRVGFLVIDDMGKANLTGAIREAVFNILDYRQAEGLPTIITTNLTLSDFARKYGDDYSDSLISRIISMGIIWPLKGEDRRIKKGQKADPLK
jgi:DNA replication protein DnaC